MPVKHKVVPMPAPRGDCPRRTTRPDFVLPYGVLGTELLRVAYRVLVHPLALPGVVVGWEVVSRGPLRVIPGLAGDSPREPGIGVEPFDVPLPLARPLGALH